MKELTHRSAAKTWKMIVLKVKFEWNINGIVLKEITDNGNIDNTTFPEIRYTGTGI